MLPGQKPCPERTECFQAAEYLTESCELLPAKHIHNQSTNDTVNVLLNSNRCHKEYKYSIKPNWWQAARSSSPRSSSASESGLSAQNYGAI